MKGDNADYYAVYDKYGDDAEISGYRRVDLGRLWRYMMTHLPNDETAKVVRRLALGSPCEKGS